MYTFFISFSVSRRRPGFAGRHCFLSGYLQQCFKLRCTLFISLFIFRRRLRVTICIHILSGYLQQHLRLRYTFFSILFFLFFSSFCAIYSSTHATQSPSEPCFCLPLPFFLLFWYFMRRNVFNGCMAVLERARFFLWLF